jgi:hypothetical protein
MAPLDKQTFIQQKVVENRNDPAGAKIYWSRHAVVEMVNDGLTRSEIEEALAQCEVIEDYPTAHRPLPDCLVLGRLASDSPVHSVVAIDEINDRIFIVTVYRPSAERWKNDWRTRK